MGQGRFAGTYRPIQRGVDFGLREHLKEDGTIWVSGTYHNIFSVANKLTQLGFKILNVITWLRRIRRPISRADTLLTPPSSLSGKEGEEGAAFLQLPVDEKTE